MRRMHRVAGRARLCAREVVRAGVRVLATHIKALLLVQLVEQAGIACQPLRGAQQQESTGAQGIVERLYQPLLQVVVHVDQQIAAGNQVHPRERRVLDHAVRREDAHLADLLDHAPVVAILAEPALQPFRRNAVQWRPIASGAGTADRLVVDVGGEDLHLGAGSRAHRLAQRDGDGVGLLAGGAAGHPDAQHVGAGAVGQHRRDRQRPQRLECDRVAEELGHPDQELAEQQFVLVRMLAQIVDVVGDGFGLRHQHAALDAPQQGLFLVLAEVVADFLVQQFADGLQVCGHVTAHAVVALALMRGVHLFLIGQQACRHLRHRQHGIDQAGGDRAGRHAGHRLVAVAGLRQRQPAVILDRAQPLRTIAAGAGQHHAHGAVTLVFGQRGEEGIDRPAMLARRRRLAYLQHAVGDGQRGIRRNHIDMPRLDAHAVRCLQHRHAGAAADQLRQQAVVVRRQVLHQHEGQFAVRRHVREKRLECFQASGRGTDADDHGAGG